MRHDEVGIFFSFCCYFLTSRMNEMKKRKGVITLPQLQSVACCLVSTSIPNSDCFKNQTKTKCFFFFLYTILHTNSFAIVNATGLDIFLFFFSSCQTAQTTMLIKLILRKEKYMGILLEIKLAKLRLKHYLSNCLFSE